MKHSLVLCLVSTLFLFAAARNKNCKTPVPKNLIFIGEFRLAQKNAPIFSIDYYVNNYKSFDLYLEISPGVFSAKPFCSAEVRAKEPYYTSYGEQRKAECLIIINDTLFKHSDVIRVRGGFNSFTSKTIKNTIPFTINRISQQPFIINDSVLKLDSPILIGAPEYVGLDCTLDYLKNSLDSNTESYPRYKYDVASLEQIRSRPFDSINLSYFQFRNFSRLLNFLEPFADDHSFMNGEAAILYDSMRNTAKYHDTSGSKVSTPEYMEPEYKKLLQEYEVMRARIAGYCNYLQLLLYNYNYYSKKGTGFFRGILQRDENAGTIKNLHVAFGASVLYGFKPLYNVNLSGNPTSDTVRFESVSKFQNTVSAGVFWSPKMTKLKFDSAKGRTDSIVQKSPFSTGLTLTYAVTPNGSQLPGTSPIGLGFAIGYQKENLGVFFHINARLIRQPRQYFIDQYKDKNLTLNTLDINDNRIFINKTAAAAGISIMYFLNFKNANTYPRSINQNK